MHERETKTLLAKLSERSERNSRILPEFYEQYPVHRGLRNKNGTGVLVGLTDVGAVHGYDLIEGVKVPDVGRLYYRGVSLETLVKGFQADRRRGFEETVYLLLFGELPNRKELDEFAQLLDECRHLPNDFTENMILKIPSKDIMNKLQRSVLVLYSHDENPDDTAISNVLWQSIQLIARFPTIISYGYQAKSHYFDHTSLFIHPPQRGIGTAENILYMIRRDNQYTKMEAETLDLCLVIHAEHGGGNNSAFATHVVSSSGTDTYSAIVAAIGSLKGPKHGGANNQVRAMIDDIVENCSDWTNRTALKNYLRRMLKKEVFNREGLIYGMGHAVYTYSDPRAVLLKEKAYELAVEKNALDKYGLYADIESLTMELFKELKGVHCVICANVDLYSGFVYEMLDIPQELYTPLFATARIAGWCAHRIEQIVSDNKIMRPAYISVSDEVVYKTLTEREC
ncbi:MULTISPECIES: citrate/2-methylcitrate synthase [unclassified Fusibacter]|uniref:citrate/2-methylcitrate synthase n=1 Tax=unclassified Fusibacter TaxID=2624464 RepID=UPI0010120CA3|nr:MULTISPECIES: citrate/2-methylcitrate synthase [unclassified Fusibacter]MCK8059108.1 citrate/2-methylcitrate synthase [Fusibacter sp. A2]NPE22517.1 citrate/2-methylcitrate synthase [Fusibacter sp. A1]RXV60620.1 citrate/2-methylcitrate synthase [Fusibacter sp. A1]